MSKHEDFSEFRYGTAEARAEAAALPIAERQRRIERMLIRYPLFKQITSSVKRFHMPVDGGTHGRGQICGLLGPSRAGKSWAIKNYVKDLGLVPKPNAQVPLAIYVDAADGWSSLDFAMEIWRTLGLNEVPRINVQKILRLVVDELVDHGVQLVVIDDAQWLLHSRLVKTVNDTKGFIVKLAEQNTCNIILSGEHRIASVVEASAHVVGRGSFPKTYVEPYDWLVPSGRENFKMLLNAIDERLPFREPSDLGDDELACHFYRISGGLIGKVRTYVQEAAFLAMNDDADHVTVHHLREAAELRRSLADPYVPFVSRVDADDPCGERRKVEEEKLHDDRTTLDKSTRRRPKPTASK